MGQSLRNISLKKSYTSKKDDMISEFFNPVLSVSKKYLRVSAYYSSYSLISISKGLSEMFAKNAEMKLIVSFFVNEKDYVAFIKGINDPKEYLHERFLTNKDELKKLMTDNNIEAFTRLVSSGKLSMKFVLANEGIFHEKYGIIFDEAGDYVSFSGSLNETLDGLTKNFEKIKVFRGWVEEENEYIETDIEEFNKYWNGEVDECLVLDIPDKTKNLINESYEEFSRERTAFLELSEVETISLRKHQEEAIEAWKNNEYRGILEMATGTGKTITALSGLKQFLGLNNPAMVILAVPTDILVNQWYNEISRLKVPAHSIKLSGKGAMRIQDLYTYIHGLDKSNIENIVLIGTYKMLSMDKFTSLIPTLFYGAKIIIADEVHHIGAENYSNAMLTSFQYRLGLSATPQRYFDDEGSKGIYEYFGGVVYSFDIKEAIYKEILCPYNYHPIVTTLTEDEMNEYASYSEKISHMLNRKNNATNLSSENRAKFEKMKELLNIQRSRIFKKAINKKDSLENILEELNKNGKLHHLLVYFEDTEQMEDFNEIFEKFASVTSIIDSSVKNEKRNLIIEAFSRGDISIILAMKILDEGVDIPAIERAVILASSGNPAQYIQRRGRLLRKSPGKEIADIFDVTVMVEDSYGINELTNIEKSLIKREMKRAKLFCETAENHIECQRLLYSVSLKYNLDF